MGYTPGPWTMDRYSREWVVAPDNDPSGEVVIARCQSEANASLIAAAPDLLAACEAAVVSADYEGKADFIRAKLLAAIAKARGSAS